MEFYDLPVLNTLFFTRKFDEKKLKMSFEK